MAGRGERNGKKKIIRWVMILGGIAAALGISSCVFSEAQFFIFPENQRVYHESNLIRDIFPGWDMDISIMSPQGDEYYNVREYVSDYSYHLAIHNGYREDSVSMKNLMRRMWTPLKEVTLPQRIFVDSVIITELPKGEVERLGLDTTLFRKSPAYYMPGIRYRYDSFYISAGCDSVRMQFAARLTTPEGLFLDSTTVDTVLFRWLRPVEEKADTTGGEPEGSGP